MFLFSRLVHHLFCIYTEVLSVILATDFDGTLSRNDIISDKDKNAIREFRSCGHHYGVISGRGYEVYNILHESSVEFDFIIGLNGAIALDSAGEIIFEKKADGKILPEVFETLKDLCSNFIGISWGKKRIEFKLDSPDGNGQGSLPFSKIHDVKSFNMIDTWSKGKDLSPQFAEIIRERHGKYLNPLPNGICIDLPPAGVDKSIALAEYANIVNVPHDLIWTAGDGYNDITMITKFRGCAMENGVEELKKAAKGTYSDIASIIEEMLSL